MISIRRQEELVRTIHLHCGALRKIPNRDTPTPSSLPDNVSGIPSLLPSSESAGSRIRKGSTTITTPIIQITTMGKRMAGDSEGKRETHDNRQLESW
jgi:hypothetical protein